MNTYTDSNVEANYRKLGMKIAYNAVHDFVKALLTQDKTLTDLNMANYRYNYTNKVYERFLNDETISDEVHAEMDPIIKELIKKHKSRKQYTVTHHNEVLKDLVECKRFFLTEAFNLYCDGVVDGRKALDTIMERYKNGTLTLEEDEEDEVSI